MQGEGGYSMKEGDLVGDIHLLKPSKWTRRLGMVKAVLSCLCLLTLLVILGFIAYHVPRWCKAADAIALHADKLVGDASHAAKWLAVSSQKSTEAMENLNQTVTDADKLIWKLDDTADAATATVSQLGSTVSQIETASVTALNSGTDALKKSTEVMGTGKQTLDAATLAVSHLDSKLSDPNIGKTLEHVESMTESGDAIAKDAAKVVHQQTNPEPKSRLKRYAIGASEWLLKLLEIGYYAHQL